MQCIYLYCCDPEGTRTLNPQNRNLIFYPLNYGAKNYYYIKINPLPYFLLEYFQIV